MTREENDTWNWAKVKEVVLGEDQREFILSEDIKQARLEDKFTERYDHVGLYPFKDSCTSIDSEEDCSKEDDHRESTTLENMHAHMSTCHTPQDLSLISVLLMHPLCLRYMDMVAPPDLSEIHRADANLFHCLGCLRKC